MTPDLRPPLFFVLDDDARRVAGKNYDAWAQTAAEAIALLEREFLVNKTNPLDVELSLDHDIGAGGQGYDAVLWLEEHDVWPGRVTIHSMNTPAADRMCAPFELSPHYRRTGPRTFTHRGL